MQLAALNGKILLTKRHGTLWDKAAVDYFEFFSLSTICTPRLRNKIPNRDLPTTNKYSSPSPPTIRLTKTPYHIICNTTTPVTYYSVYNSLYNPPHSTPTACRSYLRCLMSGATIDPALAQNVWSGPQHYDPVFISSRSKSRTTRADINLISVQLPQMPSAANIRVAFIAKEPACN
jgi:hypothetical protein